MTEKIVSIYALVDPRTNKIRYIGQTSQTVETRLRGHIDAAKRHTKTTRCCVWIRKLLRLELKPTIRLLEIVERFEDWPERERYWIAYAREHGWDIVNHTDGGEGAPGFHPSEKSRKQMSLQRRGSGNARAKITEDDVINIRYEAACGNFTQEEIANKYGVSDSLIAMIAHGEIWKEVGGCIIPKLSGKGEGNATSRLTEKDVLEIRRLFASGELSIVKLSRRYNIIPSSIASIVHGQHWREVGGEIFPPVERKGETHGMAKLNWDKVNAIRARYEKGGVSYKSLASEYGVTSAMIRNVVKGRNWKPE